MGAALRQIGTAVIILVLGLVGGGLLTTWKPSLNPFTEETVDRTGSPVLESLTEIREFHAASGHYETVVDIEKDTRFLPDWVSGERVIYVGKGDVHGVVDFSELDESRIQVSEDGLSVTVRLPDPTVGEPVLDLENSYVVNHDQGLANKFRGSDLEREAQLTAVEQMTVAASDEGMLLDLARENTTAMLRGLLATLGFEDVTITFDSQP